MKISKVKVFTGANEASANDGLKAKISSKGWWKGVASNLLSTILGIALTIGIADLVDHQQDKRQARDMMFNIVKSAEDNISNLIQYDSLQSVELEAASKILVCNLLNGDLSSMDSDTLASCLLNCYCIARYNCYSSKTENYFYSSQMMHQFSNPEIYAYFGIYVEYDESINEDIKSLHEAASKLQQKYTSILFQKGLTNREVAKELIDDGTLPDYYAYISSVKIKTKISGCKQFYDNMLLQMGATKDEFERYKSKNSIVDEKNVTTLK